MLMFLMLDCSEQVAITKELTVPGLEYRVHPGQTQTRNIDLRGESRLYPYKRTRTYTNRTVKV